MHIIALTDSEKEILENYIKRGQLETVRLRALAVTMRSRKIKLEDIAACVYRSPGTVSRWLQEFSKNRLSSLFSGNVGNQNASKLTKKQKEEIKKVIGQPPDEYGIPIEFWDVPKLKGYVKSEFNVVYESNTSYHFLLKFCGLSFKYPDRRSPRRDEEGIERRIREIREEIQPLLKDANWIVLTSDEVGLQLEAEIRRAWLMRGKRTVVKTERSKEHQNYIGFLNQETGECEIYEIKRGNSEEIIRVLEALVKRYPDKRICVIWDNARWHRSKRLREKLRKGESLERIHLIALPSYAPETNPIEHVWNYAKGKLANRVGQQFDGIKEQFMYLTHDRTFLYKI